MARSEVHRLTDIREAICRIERYTGQDESLLDFDDAVYDAISYNLAVIGEAIKDLPVETLQEAPEVDWSASARMRDFVVHRYFATDRMIVANTVQRDLPPMRAAVERLLEKRRR